MTTTEHLTDVGCATARVFNDEFGYQHANGQVNMFVWTLLDALSKHRWREPPMAGQEDKKEPDFDASHLAAARAAGAPRGGMPSLYARLPEDGRETLMLRVLRAMRAAAPIEASRTTEQERRLLETGFGVLMPDGTLVPCTMHDHFEAVLEALQASGALPEIIEEWAEFKERLEEERDAFADGYGEDEHIEWHSFEYYSSHDEHEMRSYLLGRVYAEGWARLGIHYPNGIRTLEVEATKRVLSRLRKPLDRLSLACDAIISERQIDDEVAERLAEKKPE